MTDFVEKLEKLAHEAREQRLSGDHHHGQDSEFSLIGYCFDNAYVMWHVLDEAGIEARMIEGTTERVADDLITEGFDPTTFDSVDELAGLVHYWIEVDAPSGDQFYIDIASDSFETLGQCLVTKDLPTDYTMLPDSRESAQEKFESVREEDIRCLHCGDLRYDYGGCPTCQGTLSEDLK